MDKNFERIKKSRLTAAIIKSAVCGLAAGTFAAGAVLLGLKLGQVEIHFAYYILIGVAAAALAGAGAFFLLRPTDKKVAAKLDAEHRLNEKTQTMVAFYGREGDLYELQRSDAEAKLAALPKSKPDFKKLWQYAVAMVIALAVFVTSLVLPANASDNPGPYDEPFTFTDNQKAALLSLKSDVESSHLTENDKSATVTALDALYSALEQAEYQRQMKTAVVSTVSFIDGVLYTANSFDDIAYYLSATEDLTELANAITDGVTFYRSSTVPFFTMESVTDAEKNMETSVTEKVQARLDEFVKVYDITKADGLKDKIVSLNKAANVSVENEAIDENDLIAAAVIKFTDGMSSVAELSDTFQDDYFQKQIKAAVAELIPDLYDALAPQAYNCIMNEYVRQRLVQIFGLKQADLPRLLSGVREIDNRPPDDDDKNPDGSQGGDDKVFASNETVYHTEKGEVVIYGEYHSSFRAAMLEQLEKSDLSDSLKEYIKAYFDAMGSGLQKPDGDGNEEN